MTNFGSFGATISFHGRVVDPHDGRDLVPVKSAGQRGNGINLNVMTALVLQVAEAERSRSILSQRLENNEPINVIYRSLLTFFGAL